MNVPPRGRPHLPRTGRNPAGVSVSVRLWPAFRLRCLSAARDKAQAAEAVWVRPVAALLKRMIYFIYA